MQIIKKIITILSISALFIINTVGIMAMSDHHHETGCPFMLEEQAVCEMTALDHIVAWQSTFTITLPTLFVYLFIFVATFFVWKHYIPSDLFVRRPTSRCTRDSMSVSLYQKLFSSGILNPKAP